MRVPVFDQPRSSGYLRREKTNGQTPRRQHQIFIVEDHPVIRELYSQLIQRELDLEVCGFAATGEEAVAAISAKRPDLVLLDVNLPDASGIEVLRRLLQMNPLLSVLVISGQEENIYAPFALQAGAQGFLHKLDLAQNLVRAIRKALAGHTVVSDHIYRRLQQPQLGIRHRYA